MSVCSNLKVDSWKKIFWNSFYLFQKIMNQDEPNRDSARVSVDEVPTENMSNLSYLPLSHEHIIRSILLYSDSKTLLACENVCTTWRWWISSSTIWPDMLELVATRAKSLAWSIRYCTLSVGEGWLIDCASDFVLNRLQHLEENTKWIVKGKSH